MIIEFRNHFHRKFLQSGTYRWTLCVISMATCFRKVVELTIKPLWTTAFLAAPVVESSSEQGTLCPFSPAVAACRTVGSHNRYFFAFLRYLRHSESLDFRNALQKSYYNACTYDDLCLRTVCLKARAYNWNVPPIIETIMLKNNADEKWFFTGALWNKSWAYFYLFKESFCSTKLNLRSCPVEIWNADYFLRQIKKKYCHNAWFLMFCILLVVIYYWISYRYILLEDGLMEIKKLLSDE